MQNLISLFQKPAFLAALLCASPFVSSPAAQNSQSGSQTATQAACSSASQSGAAPQNNSTVADEKQNIQNAAKQLGSLFKKKPASPPAAAANPCPAAGGAPVGNADANATPAPAASPASAPAAPAAASAPPPAAAPAAAASQAPAPQAMAPASTLAGVQLPPAPPGGLDPSKLPDIVSIHIGTPTDKVIAQLNSLYPLVRNDRGTEIWGPGGGNGDGKGESYTKYASTNDSYISAAGYARPFTDPCPSSPDGCQSGDQISAIFSGPPKGNVLVRLQRVLSYGSGTPTTTDNLIAALTQKYGPNFTTYPDASTLQWAFDETGKPLPAPKLSVNCAGILSPQGFPPPNPIPLTAYLGLMGAGTMQQQLTPILRNRCSFILVTAQINGRPGGPANQMTVTIQELPEDLRDAFAAEIYMEQAASAQSNQQLKNAQQQKAPVF